MDASTVVIIIAIVVSVGVVLNFFAGRRWKRWRGE